MTGTPLPSTPMTKIERRPICTPGGRVKEEKIFVTVRMRPMNKHELSLKDQTAWECIDGKRIVYKLSSQDRSNLPASYTFDKVFGSTCSTETVYEEGAKHVALSAVTGINAAIFAYGQTSSGKTYTMCGITEYAVNDIYKHQKNTPERDFTIKMSAMEIYNEVVRDLLNPDSGPLRLLDDPEKGTIVEKLEEKTAKDSQHLKQLISICEAQRQVGETALNDTSSRSHQIIRLTIESTSREKSGCVKSFIASLNFVDLAGSERAAQTHAIGTRLKEGCHINRSLLTLTTVIRKLSQGKKSNHIPYRDSKLTRILQLSLGGNARTAIICTMSPAQIHVEQSRNTLFFATCAKEVTNTAQINVVVSDKQLVKQLQKEVARLEAELRTPEPSTCSQIILREKELKIKQMEIEIEELKQERDLAYIKLNELQKKISDNHKGLNLLESSPNLPVKCLTFSGPPSSASDKVRGKAEHSRNMMRQSAIVPTMLVHEIRKLEQLQKQLGQEAKQALEILQKEVSSHRPGSQGAAETIGKLQEEIKEMRAFRATKDIDYGDAVTRQNAGSNLKEEITRLHSQGNSIANLEEMLENLQTLIDKLVMCLPAINHSNETSSKSFESQLKKRKILPLTPSSNINQPNHPSELCSPIYSTPKVLESGVENKPPNSDGMSCEVLSALDKVTPSKSEQGGDISSRKGNSTRKRSSSENMKKIQTMFENAVEENVRSIKAYVTELKERVAKLQYQKQLLVCQVLELEANEAGSHENAQDENENISGIDENPDTWELMFQEHMQQIIQLWDVCHVSLIHRTQFYLLFRGDPADQMYLEVELRRLTWLQQHFIEVGNASPTRMGDESIISLSSSIRALRHEREFLSKRLNSRLTEEERERLYMKWQVPVEGKLRKLQFVNKLWTDPTDPAHIEESANIVARLVGFCEQGNVTKEMFALNFPLPTSKKPWLLGWQPLSDFLGL